MKSHLHTRESAGLFDVSHMLGVIIRGTDRVSFMESLCVADLAALPPGMGTLSVLTNAGGGIIDDMIVTNAGEHLYMVINAGHEDKDLPHMEEHLKKFVAGGKVSKLFWGAWMGRWDVYLRSGAFCLRGATAGKGHTPPSADDAQTGEVGAVGGRGERGEHTLLPHIHTGGKGLSTSASAQGRKGGAWTGGGYGIGAVGWKGRAGMGGKDEGRGGSRAETGAEPNGGSKTALVILPPTPPPPVFPRLPPTPHPKRSVLQNCTCPPPPPPVFPRLQDCSIETLPHNGILALQGPKAAAVLQSLTSADIPSMSFMSARTMDVCGVECFVARSGYTGEDGFEIAVPPGKAGAHPVTAIW